MRIDARHFLSAVVLLVAATSTSLAYDQGGPKRGQVFVTVHPSQAYVWVDGKPADWGEQTLKLEPGGHTITVYNYGYELVNKQVTVESGKRQKLNVRLNRSGSQVSPPWGRIQIEGVPDDALVFLNGTTPGFFVGHAGEMNNAFFVVQRLIVPVGKQELFIISRKTNQPIWSGPVEVKENKRLIVYVKGGQGNKNAKMVYKDWAEGKQLSNFRRYDAMGAAVSVAVAPVSAQLAADPASIHCDQKGRLTWNSANAAQTVITANDQKIAAGQQGRIEVDPKENTAYQIRAAGPGGVVTKDASVNVDSTVKTSLTISNPELRFVKVGDTVKQQDSADLAWTATNADTVEIDRIGQVNGQNGTQTIQATPTNTNEGEVNETQVYKITAKNDCGGSDTSEVAVHLTGSIEPEVVAQATPPPQLPHTSTPLPLLALFGLAALGTGALLRMLSK